MNSNESSPPANSRPLPRAISRDGRARVLAHEQTLSAPAPVVHEELKTPRREFFRAVLPASGKLLTELLRTVGATISVAIDDAKSQKK